MTTNPYESPRHAGQELDERADQSQSAPETLPRVLGPFSATTTVVGSIIGSGVFLKAAVIAEGFGKAGLEPSFGPIICVWIAMGVVTLCGSLALAELAAMLPQAGGPYVYLREAYGRLTAFLYGWTEFWIIRTGSIGSLACATVIYLDKFLVLTFGTSAASGGWLPLNPWVQCGLAIVLVLLLTGVNVVGTRWGAALQNVTTVIKVGFLALLITAPFVMGSAHPSNLEPIWPDDVSFPFWKVLGITMIAVLWPYDGWVNIGPVTEEIKNPQRNVPLALTVGLIIVIAVYVGANIGYHLVLPMDQIASSSGVAADVCVAMFGTFGGQLAAIGVMCSTFGAINSNLFTGPRIFFAMARDGVFPKALSRVHPSFQTPSNAILAQGAWTVLLLIGAFAWVAMRQEPAPPNPTGGEAAASSFSAGDAFDSLTDFVIFGGSAFYALTVAAVFVLRTRQPKLPRPYRTWGYPVTPIIYLVAFVALLVSLLVGKFYETAIGTTLILAGVAYYFLVNRRTSRHA